MDSFEGITTADVELLYNYKSNTFIIYNQENRNIIVNLFCKNKPAGEKRTNNDKFALK